VEIECLLLLVAVPAVEAVKVVVNMNAFVQVVVLKIFMSKRTRIASA